MKEDDLRLGLEVVQAKPRNIDKIAIIRHGEYGDNERLSRYGRTQMEQIGKSLKLHLTSDETAFILSSSALRALDSARILSKALNAPIKSHELLWSEVDQPPDFEAAHRLIHAVTGSNLVVVVTHYEFVQVLPTYLCRTDLGEDASHDPIGKGKGVLLDYKARSLVTL